MDKKFVLDLLGAWVRPICVVIAFWMTIWVGARCATLQAKQAKRRTSDIEKALTAFVAASMATEAASAMPIILKPASAMPIILKPENAVHNPLPARVRDGLDIGSVRTMLYESKMRTRSIRCRKTIRLTRQFDLGDPPR
jgi:hypothetical protein